MARQRNAADRESERAKRVMVMMRGLSGSGKSTLARQLAGENGGAVISADDHFVGTDGVYRYDRRRIREAHREAQQRVAFAFMGGRDYVVIDNTHITHRDMADYLEVAARVGARLELFEPMTPWAWDVEECARRNVHGVPLDIIQSMKDRYQPMTTAEARDWVEAIRNGLPAPSVGGGPIGRTVSVSRPTGHHRPWRENRTVPNRGHGAV